MDKRTPPAELTLTSMGPRPFERGNRPLVTIQFSKNFWALCERRLSEPLCIAVLSYAQAETIASSTSFAARAQGGFFASLRRSRGSARLKTDIALNLPGQHAGQQPGLNFEHSPIIYPVTK